MKKNALLTFIFACIPGAGQMYYGYMRRGLSLVTLFCVASGIGVIIPPILLATPIIWMYAFFDTFPVIDVRNPTGVVEHEATTSKISDDQLFYCNQRGLSTEDAVGLIVNGYAREVLAKLPMEFAVEAQKLLSISLEGSVG